MVSGQLNDNIKFVPFNEYYSRFISVRKHDFEIIVGDYL